LSEVFHVCASQGGNNCVELDLPASDYEMLDLMERLRLEPGQPPYLEILRYREEFDYLEKCIHDQPDICQLNALARKLSAFSGMQDMAVFEGLVGKEIGEKSRTIPILRLIDFACGTEGSPVAEGVMTDIQLGKFLVENEFVEEANSLPDAALALLDYGKIGREHRAEGNRERGIYGLRLCGAALGAPARQRGHGFPAPETGVHHPAQHGGDPPDRTGPAGGYGPAAAARSGEPGT